MQFRQSASENPPPDSTSPWINALPQPSLRAATAPRAITAADTTAKSTARAPVRFVVLTMLRLKRTTRRTRTRTFRPLFSPQRPVPASQTNDPIASFASTRYFARSHEQFRVTTRQKYTIEGSRYSARPGRSDVPVPRDRRVPTRRYGGDSAAAHRVVVVVIHHSSSSSSRALARVNGVQK